MFIELAAIVCTGAMACKDISFTFAPTEISLVGCMIGGQQHLAKWTSTHPNWQVKRWSCGVAGRYAKI